MSLAVKRLGLLVCLCGFASSAAARGGKLTLIVIDRDTGAPIACRMHLKNARGVAVKEKKVPFWGDHFVFGGEITLTLPVGEYRFEIERGPEYLDRTGHFTINDFAEDTHTMDLKRVVDMSKEGWWSGDLFVDRPEKDLPLLMDADDIHVVQLFSKPPAKGATPVPAVKPARPPKAGEPSATGPWVSLPERRWYCRQGLADSRAGNLILFCNLAGPLVAAASTVGEAADPTAKAPAVWELAAEVRRQPSAWIDAGRAFSWDLPLLVAEGMVDSVELASSHLGRSSVLADEAGGYPRDKRTYGSDSGIGRWGETIYYHLLNCGLRLPPSAGSGSGQAPNPVGYNRVYVQLDGEFSVEKWWEGFRAGRVVVSNGPLLRPKVEGEAPGHVFEVAAGDEREFEIALTLSTKDPVDYLELVQDGEVVHMVRLDEWAQQKGHLPLLNFKRSGWFLVRAVTAAVGTYRFASSAPYYANVGDQPRVSRASAQFFLDWLNQRAKTVLATDASDVAKERFESARKFWQAMVDRANAD
jgi:hypothetical protein